jgi:type II secretory pathway pseudopilin PulG
MLPAGAYSDHDNGRKSLMKLWGSLKQQAGKVAFDADKAIRARREENAIAALRDQVEAQYTEAGRVVLNLMAEEGVVHPVLQPLAHEVSRLQAEIRILAEKLTAIQAEEYQPQTDQPGPEPAGPTGPAQTDEMAATVPPVGPGEPPSPPPPPSE